MIERTARVWAEEVEPPGRLRFTWAISGEDEADVSLGEVAATLSDLDGVLSVAEDGDGLLVEIDAERITRYRLAAEIRQRLGAAAPASDRNAEAVARVWVEDLAEDRIRVTWQRLDSEAERTSDERRRVAAWLAALPGARSATLDDDGVLLRYKQEVLDRPAVGSAVRSALVDEDPLRERAEALMRRSPTYGKLAQRLALDERVSPLPDAAKQAIASRRGGGVAGSMARTSAMRFIPGAAMVSRIQTLLPVLQELSTWSRTADPAVVDEHLVAVGLSRETLKQDTVTAHEMRLYARDFAAEATSELAGKAAEGARRAFTTGRDVAASVRESASAEWRRRQEAAGPEDERDPPEERREG